MSLPSWRCRISRAGSGCLCASSSRTSWAVLCSPPGVFESDGSFSSSKRTWRSCGAELMLNGPPGELVDLGLDRRHLVGELGRELPQPRDVHRDADPLHPRQDRDQGPFEVGVEVPEPFVPDLRGEDRLDPPGGVGVLAGVLGDLRDVDLVHPRLGLPLADQVGDRDHRVAEQPLGELVEVVVPLAALEQVAEDHRVGDRPGQLDARPGQGQHVVLEVLADLLDRRVLQDRPEGRQRGRLVEPSRSFRPADGRGNTPRPPSRRTRARPARPGAGRARWSRCRGRTAAGASARPGTRRTTRGCRPDGIRRPRAGRPRGLCGGGRAQLVAEAVEAALAAEGLQGLAVGRLEPEGLPVDLHRQVGAQGHQLPRPAGRLGVVAEACCFLGPLTSPGCARRASSVPNSLRNVAA